MRKSQTATINMIFTFTFLCRNFVRKHIWEKLGNRPGILLIAMGWGFFVFFYISENLGKKAFVKEHFRFTSYK